MKVDLSSDDAWWTDEPLEALHEDRLGRQLFVDRLGQLLDQVAKDSASTVIGLAGPWGSGKSSTINFTLQNLNRDYWCVAKINPWALSGPDAVIAELLAGITSALPSNDSKSKKARDALVAYGGLAIPLVGSVPLVGELARFAGELALSRLKGQMTVQQQAEQVSRELRDYGRPILIVIDDIDRLQPYELLALFKAVRVLGHLPHVNYLVAYDEQTVIDLLLSTQVAANHPARALAFLEKIVTLKLDQPPTRADQVDSLLDSGLNEVFERLAVSMTPDQQRRLAQERDLVLRQLIREPRTVSRFLAQLRTYLPLIGTNEIDIVDFAVITALRMAYPGLYQQLDSSQNIVTSAPGAFDEDAIMKWRELKPEEFDITSSDHRAVSGALSRLFPVLNPDFDMVPRTQTDLRILRRDCRIGCPDYVQRYFALIPPDTDLSDSTLSRAIEEWLAGQPGTAVDDVGRILKPDPTNLAQCELAARVLRRAESRSEALSPSEAATLLPVALDLLPMPSLGRAAGGPHVAAIAWLASMLSRANGPDPEEILARTRRASSVIAPLDSFLDALRRVLPDPTVAMPLRLIFERGPANEWLALLADACAKEAWLRLIDHVNAGDSAAADSVEPLISWLEEYHGKAEVSRRLAASVTGGVSLSDLAARFVMTARDFGTDVEVLVGFEAVDLIDRLGHDNVASRRAQITAAANEVPMETRLNEADASWTNRRRLAARQLLKILDADANRGARLRLPDVAEDKSSTAFINHDLSLLEGGELPELRLQVSILTPAAPTLPVADARTSSIVGGDRERAVLELLTDSPATQWMRQAAQPWRGTVELWDIRDTDASSIQSALASIQSQEPNQSSERTQHPVAIGAQFRTGRHMEDDASAGNHETSVLLTLVVGFWLVELDGDRRPDQIRHSEYPAPAALSLEEMYSLIQALVNCATTALTARARLTNSSSENDTDLLIDIRLDAPTASLPATIDYGSLPKVGSVTRGQHRQTVRVKVDTVTPRPVYTPTLEMVAIAFVDNWLKEANYRDYEEMLYNLWKAHSQENAGD